MRIRGYFVKPKGPREQTFGKRCPRVLSGPINTMTLVSGGDAMELSDINL